MLGPHGAEWLRIYKLNTWGNRKAVNMEWLKAILGDALYSQVTEALKGKENEVKLANLAGGAYVSKEKHEALVSEAKAAAKAAQDALAARDADMATLKTAMEAAQADATKLPGLQEQLTGLQTRYESEKSALEKQLADQAYTHVLRDSMTGLEFTSEGAKKAFISDVQAKAFKVEEDKLVGFNEFLDGYRQSDPGAFKEKEESTPPSPAGTPPAPPVFVAPGAGTPAGGTPATGFAFAFQGVRPKPTS